MLLVRNIFEDILTYGNSMRYHESWKLFCIIIFLFSADNICYVYSKQLHTLINNWWRKYLLKLKVASITNISIFHLEQNCWNDCSLHLIIHPALQCNNFMVLYYVYYALLMHAYVSLLWLKDAYSGIPALKYSIIIFHGTQILCVLEF